MRRALLVIASLLLAVSASADDSKPPSTGLYFFANAGAFWASSNTADFYSGKPTNTNTINRVLYSNTYGIAIWNSLVEQHLISPSTIGSYNQLQVVEYPSMHYRTSLQIGLGLRYEYKSGFGWLLRFDVDQLEAIGAFNLSSTNGTGILGSDQYIRCGMLGKENRYSIDLAITRQLQISNTVGIELDLGASLANTEVKENMMEIGGLTYNILDLWGGQTPNHGVGEYEYINQGGIGYGVFISLLTGWNTPLGNIKASYTCYQTRIVLENHTAWGWQHSLGLRIEMNNF